MHNHLIVNGGPKKIITGEDLKEKIIDFLEGNLFNVSNLTIESFTKNFPDEVLNYLSMTSEEVKLSISLWEREINSVIQLDLFFNSDNDFNILYKKIRKLFDMADSQCLAMDRKNSGIAFVRLEPIYV